MLSKCLIPFSIDGWGCVSFLLFTWGQTMVEVMKIMVTSFKRSQACTTILSASDPAAGHHRPTPPPETPRHSWQVWVSLLWVTAPFSWVSVHKLLLCPLRVRSPVLYEFWGLSGGVNGDLLQKHLRHTQVRCTQSPGPCGRPLLTRTSTGDTHTRICLSLCGASGSWGAHGLFEPLSASGGHGV